MTPLISGVGEAIASKPIPSFYGNTHCGGSFVENNKFFKNLSA